MTLSICTIARGRAGHLENLVHGLRAQTDAPEELIISVMQPDLYSLPATGFPIRQIRIDRGGLSLAAARNAAAGAAVGEKLAFLDVDCIPAPDFVADYRRLLDGPDMLLMGEVLYLPPGEAEGAIDYARFARRGVLHSERAAPPASELGDCTDYRCFWSLNFAIRKSVFQRVGGFDESYVGYGGEDTDFGRVVATCGVPIKWCRGARAYHQYHPHHMPPVHHIDSVIANAVHFSRKWGHYTMEHWLHAFVLMGLVRMEKNGPVRVREVTEADLALTRQREDEPYASAANVVALLERRAAVAAA